MAKPVTVPTWATTGGTTATPTSAKQNAGFVGGEKPPAKFFNWLFNLIYQWILYLQAGSFTGGVTADTLHVTGAVTADAAMTVGTTLGVTGTTTAAAVNGTTFTASTNYKHSFTKTLVLSPVSGTVTAPARLDTSAGAGVITNDIELVTASTEPSIVIPIPLCIGDTVSAVRVILSKNSAAGAITAKIRKITSTTGGIGQQGTTATSLTTATGNNTLLTITSTFTFASGIYYHVTVTGGGTTGDIVYGIEVDYTR